MQSRLGVVPGVETVGLGTTWPMQQPRPESVERAGDGQASTRSAVHAVSPGYFATLDIPIEAGRAFHGSDRLGSEPVALVSATLARRLWPGGDAVGSRIRVPEAQERGEPLPVVRLVVGVVADVRQQPADADLADVYVPLLQTPGRFAFVQVRTAGSPEHWLAPFRAAFRDIDPEISVQRARPLQALVDEATARPRFLATLLTSFALVAGALTLVGVYGVMAYAIRQREREIALRIAIGADPGRITRLLVRQGGVVLAAGLALGIVGALAGGRLIEAQLFAVTPRDPLALALAVGTFAAAGLLAIWWPSRRAAATDPAIALRAE
jgi:hypothetical protein